MVGYARSKEKLDFTLISVHTVVHRGIIAKGPQSCHPDGNIVYFIPITTAFPLSPLARSTAITGTWTYDWGLMQLLLSDLHWPKSGRK